MKAIIIILSIIIILEVLLSLPRNKYIGFILPTISLLCSVGFLIAKAPKTSIFLFAYTGLLLIIFTIVKAILKRKKRKKIDMMKINDL